MRRSDDRNPPIKLVGGSHGHSGSRLSSAGSSASSAARRAKPDGFGGRISTDNIEAGRHAKYKRSAAGFASMLRDDNGLSHTRAGLAMRQRNHRTGARMLEEKFVNESDSESESDYDEDEYKDLGGDYAKEGGGVPRH